MDRTYTRKLGFASLFLISSPSTHSYSVDNEVFPFYIFRTRGGFSAMGRLLLLLFVGLATPSSEVSVLHCRIIEKFNKNVEFTLGLK